MYIGISPSKFDQLVKAGHMPGAKRIDGCVIWDVRALDRAFDELPGEAHSSSNPDDWDNVGV